MTQLIPLGGLKKKIEATIPDSVSISAENYLLAKADRLVDICRLLKDDKELSLDYLSNLTATDYEEHYEVIYRLVSFDKNHSVTLKVRLDKDNPSLSSVCDIWRGADFQEREVYDLMGIAFNDHPNLKRIMLWEGFKGHPLRKDYSLDA